ncbi:LLM class flavin-dependent oxidoreductase [Geodermatophilus sp. URMC 64]
MQVSVAFPTALDSHENIALAEELGYERAWLYDTPQNSPDVWMALALAAERTTRIGLGPGVLVPSLRHPMVNAAATAALVALAPGRVEVAFGTGFSGRRAMGYRGIRWSFMADYIRAYRGLLRGEVVEWEGAKMQMLHPAGHAPARPIDVPILISALGPKGAEVTRELADGLYATLQLPDFAREFSRVSYLAWGTVLDEGEDPTSERVRLAGGPGTALAWHGAYEFGGQAAVADLAGGQAWNDVVSRTPDELRHIAVHTGHCVELNEADQAAWDAGGSTLLESTTLSGTAEQVRGKLQDLADAGVTEIVFQPCGPDVRRELERFLEAARSSTAAARS